jgi:hypothetical protein
MCVQTQNSLLLLLLVAMEVAGFLWLAALSSASVQGYRR